MIQEATAMTVRRSLGQLLDDVRDRHNAVLITRDGKPMAAMVDMELFGKIRLMGDAFERMTRELALTSVDSEQVEEDIAEAVRAVRDGNRACGA